MPVLAVFGSSNVKPGDVAYDLAEQIAERVASHGWDVATGAYSGVMEAALKGAKDSQVRRIGITTEIYPDKKPNQYITELINEGSYIDRLLKLIDIADAYLILPGGTGTLVELAVVWALKSRNLCQDKQLIVMGEQWQEALEVLKFYSESMIEKSKLIHFATSIDDIEQLFIKKK